MLYKMKLTTITAIVLSIFGCGEDDRTSYDPPSTQEVNVDFYLTTPDKTNLLAKTSDGLFPMTSNENQTINVTENDTFQTMDGFGYTLTGGSAILLNDMSSSARAEILQELFGNGESDIGVSYLRVSIGSSDLDPQTFSYNDMPTGQTDENLNNFSLNPDMANLIPVLQEILQINPDIKILGSPWSAPVWMKTNGSTIGGELQTQYYDTYANYFVKYIKGMEEQGITVDAITIQNEPENPFNNPSMLMSADQQKVFIRDHLGPLFDVENIDTKIILFDHNLDNPDYPISIMNDPATKNYVNGSAFHLYAGRIDNMSLVRDAHPDKNLYFTEQWIESPGDFTSDLKWHIRELLVGAPRNWSKNVLQWNLAADPNSDPHTDGGCTKCLGAITIDGNSITRNPGYYNIAHTSKFVPPGSVRIASNYILEFPNVAYKTPDNRIVVLVLNNSDVQNTLNINVESEPITATLPAGAVATFVWQL